MFKFDSNVNIVSLSNLIVLGGILITATGTWYTMRSTVDGLQNKIELLDNRLRRANESREAAVTALRTRNETLIELFQNSQQQTVERMAVIETKVDVMAGHQKRTQETIDTILRRLPMRGGQ